MSLKVAVIGAGLGGLTAAAALYARGLDVEVYERGEALREQGVGMHLGPNGTRLLERLGLGPRLAELAVRPEALEVRAFHNGAQVAVQEMGEAWERRFRAPYLTVHRGDLHRMLAGTVPAERVHTGKELLRYAEDADGVLLEFADGTTARADVLVGADGVHSAVRRAVAGEDAPVYSGNSALRGLVDAADVPALDPGRMYMFAGPAARVLCYPVSGGRQFTYVVVTPAPEGDAESWTSATDPADLDAVLEGWAPQVRDLVGAAGEVRRWALYDRAPLERWSTPRVTLLGDAAHPMLPHHGQGANQAVEDAVALAVCLARATEDAEGVAAALERYEALRRPHTTRVQLGSRTGGRPAPQQGGRPGGVNDAAADVAWILDHDVEAALDQDLPAPARAAAAAA
ncbi:FAD-dependent monooxygenase [Streptomyces sp. NBC_00249]|uniref:FAD-dependent monooxygenase n=1 Tax=Streptomyces sp. NBC_00249 TaxID=2975690 RepID=UPI0022500E41|nr:FAD-dependent monooxygenase [Streptomyces sp. NBC_00249]MCX5193845.1 FAD-dependent monooxygenase [Streptomyces sp. NBC_00249]